MRAPRRRTRGPHALGSRRGDKRDGGEESAEEEGENGVANLRAAPLGRGGRPLRIVFGSYPVSLNAHSHPPGLVAQIDPTANPNAATTMIGASRLVGGSPLFIAVVAGCKFPLRVDPRVFPLNSHPKYGDCR